MPSDEKRSTKTTAAWRLVRIIEAVGTADAGVGVRSLAREIGIDKSAVSRLLRQLESLGVVDSDLIPGRYSVGPRLFAIARAAANRDQLGRAAKPMLEELVRNFNETVYLATLEGDQVVYRDMVECSRPVRYVVELGKPSPIHAGAGGRAILAGLSDADAERLLGRGRLSRLTAKTITDRTQLRKAINADRKRGFSVSFGERVSGGAAVAAPYFAADGTCRGSIVAAFPLERLKEHDIENLGRMVSHAAADLSERLGYRHNLPTESRSPLRSLEESSV
jgi:DNA-binding IclR family transcriptional regulator